ncbi:hypothetical protein D9M68_524940 [compost metagenome]
MFVLDQFDVRTALPVLELERAGADRRIVVRILRQGRVHIVKVLGQDRAAADVQGIQEGGVWLLQLENYRLRVQRRDFLHIGHQGPRARRVGQNLGVGEYHVVSGERLAVMPLHLGLQMECVGQLVGRHFPGLRQTGLRRQVEGVGQQTFEDLAGHQLRAGNLLHGHVQRGGFRTENGGQDAAILRRFRGVHRRRGIGKQAGGGQGAARQGVPGIEGFHGRDFRVKKGNRGRAQACSGSTPHQSWMNSASEVATRTMLSTDTHSLKPCTFCTLGP